MEQAEILEFTQQALILIVKISTPIMMIGLIVGVIVALVQALTQVQEMTLAFVPKIVAVFFAIVTLLPAMMVLLVNFTETIAERISNMG